MRGTSPSYRTTDGGAPLSDRRHRRPRSTAFPRLRDACVVAGCFGLISVQLFSSLTLMGLRQAVEEAARPSGEQSRKASSKAVPDLVGKSLRALRSSSDFSSVPRRGGGHIHSEPSIRGRQLPTCNCPLSCDVSTLSKRHLAGNQGSGSSGALTSCRERIVYHQLTHKVGELQSCLMAVEEGFCGMECHPTKCGADLVDSTSETDAGVGAQPGDTADVTTESTQEDKPVAVAEEAPTTELDSATPLPWSRMQNLERPHKPFQRHDHVVVATKIMGPDRLDELKQMFCLFMAAYNRHVNYDIVVFTTLPWEEEAVQQLRDVVGPNVNLTVALEAKPLSEQVADMSPEDRDYLYRRCRVPPDGQISYYHWCLEEPNGTDKPFYDVRLSYAWQAEFRAKHVWHAPVLERYKYMLWIDSDAFCTRPWAVDPVQVAVENDLVILFDNFPGDSADNPILKDKMMRAYNRSLCELSLVDGHFRGRDCDASDENNPRYWLRVVHGFLHVTNLDFYRSPSVTRFLDEMLGGKRFSREWDDQLAVTVPAAMEAPERAWDMRSNGMHLQVYHNGNIDGKLNERPSLDDNFVPYWNETAKSQWDFGRDVCERYIVSNG